MSDDEGDGGSSGGDEQGGKAMAVDAQDEEEESMVDAHTAYSQPEMWLDEEAIAVFGAHSLILSLTMKACSLGIVSHRFAAAHGYFLVAGIGIPDDVRSCDYYQGCGRYWRHNMRTYATDITFKRATKNTLGEGEFVQVCVRLEGQDVPCVIGWIAEWCKEMLVANYCEDGADDGVTAKPMVDFSIVEGGKDLVKACAGAAVVRVSL